MNTNEPCAAVFPVDEDFMRLPNNDVIQLEGRQQKITYYLKHDEKREKIARTGYNRVKGTLSMESSLRRILNNYVE